MVNMLKEINYCTMYLDERDDYHFEQHQIEFIINFNQYARNKITLLNVVDDDDSLFYNPCIYKISPSEVLEQFSEIITVFKNDGNSYTLPYGIMLDIMAKYDTVMHKKYQQFHLPTHDDIVIDHHVIALHERHQKLLSMKKG